MLKKIFNAIKSTSEKSFQYFFSGSGKNIFRGMITLAAGNIAARAIGLACIPILTRLYAPSDFGVLAVYTSLVTILAPLITLRYVLALPLPKRTGMATNLLAVSFIVMALNTLIVTVVFGASAPTLLTALSAAELIPYWYLIVVGTLSVATYEMLTLWATRNRAYKRMAQSTTLQSLAGNATKIAFGLNNLKPVGLILGHAISFLASTIFIYILFKGQIKKHSSFITKKRIIITAKRFRQFPLYRLPSQLLLAFSTQAPVLFFAHAYNAEVTGQLSMALLIIALPMFVIGEGMSKAYYAEAAKIGAKAPGELRAITIDVSKKLFVASLIPALTLFLLGPEIFKLVLGSEWERAGIFASALSIYLVSQFITAPIVTIFNVIEKNAFFLALNTVRAMGLFVVLYLIPKSLNLQPATTITIYSLFMAAFYLGIYIFIISYLKKQTIK